MKKLIILLAVLWLAQDVGAQNSQAFSLQQAIDYALQNDRTVKNKQLGVAEANSTINETKSIGLPKVNGKIDYQNYLIIPKFLLPQTAFDPINGDPNVFEEIEASPRNSLVGSLDASWLAFDATYLTGLKASRLYKEYAQLDVKNTERSVEKSVTEAYVATLVLNVSKTTLENNIKNLEQLITETEAMYKAGFVEQLDVDRLVLSLQNLKTELLNLNTVDEQLKKMLKFAMSYPLDQDIEVTDDIDMLLAADFALPVDEQLDLGNRPEIALVNKGLELSDLDIEQYQKGYYPNLVVFSSFQYQIQGNNLFDNPNAFPIWVAGLTTNIPIFDGFEKRSKIEKAEIAREQTFNQKEDLIRGINLEVENARLACETAQKRLETTKASQDLAQKIYNTTRIKYKEGVGSSFEILQAEQELYSAQGNYQQALYDYLKAKSDLKIALGK